MAVLLEQAIRAALFVHALGMNTHFNITNSSYGHVSAVAEQLQFLGIKRVRDYPGNSPAIVASERMLGAQGIRFDMLVDGNLPLPRTMAAIDALAPYVDTVEGPNEIDITPVHFEGLAGPAAAIALQKALYATVHADPLLNGQGRRTGVLTFTLSLGQSYAPYGDLSAYTDYTNVHAYGGGGVPPQWFLQAEIKGVTMTHGHPVIVTESGQNTMPGFGQSEAVQAKLLLNTVFDNFKNGVAATFIYELDDDHPDPNNTNHENHYGVFRADGTRKRAAVALHNLTTILADSGPAAPSFPVGSLDYGVTGLPGHTGASQVLLQKSNGTYAIALWQEPKIWDDQTKAEIPFPPSHVTITLGQSAPSVSVYDPMAGTTPVATYRDANTVDVELGSHPLIIEIAPKPVTAR